MRKTHFHLKGFSPGLILNLNQFSAQVQISRSVVMSKHDESEKKLVSDFLLAV